MAETSAFSESSGVSDSSLSEAAMGFGEAAADQSSVQAAGKTANQDWLTALPESLRGVAQDADSLDAVQAALKHGLTHSPLSRVDDVSIEAPEGAVLDDEGAQWFKETAVKAGLSNVQVKALVDGYNAQAAVLQESLRQSAEAELRAEYGAGYESKLAKASDACKRFNEMTKGGLEPILQSGLGNHPGFIRFMMAISDAVSDSSMPGSVHSSASGPMSTEEFLKRSVFNS